MALVKPQAPPGFLSQATQVQARGGWYAGNLVRWRTGLLEKWAGWRRLYREGLPQIIRRMHAWLDLDNKKNLLVAADDGVHLLVQDTLYGLGRQIDLQGAFVPALGSSGPAATFSVALGSTTVTVTTSAIVTAGTSFLLRLPISIGGRVILANSFFTVKAAVTNGFTFDMLQPALVAETGTYGVPLLTNDIVNGFTITWKAHGFTAGLEIRVAQETTIRVGTPPAWEKLNFSAPAGTLGTVANVIDADHFTLMMGAHGTGDGAGGASHQIYVGGFYQQNLTSGAIDATPGSVIGLAIARPLGDPQRNAWFLANMGGKFGLVLASGGPLEVYKTPVENGPFLNPVNNPYKFGVMAGAESVPQKSMGMIVAMPQAQVILFGTEAVPGEGVIDPLLIAWTHVGTYDQFESTVSNQSGTMRLSRGSRIVGMIQAPQSTLILTDTDLWQMTYIGPPLIYGFAIVGSGCGLVAPHAIGNLGRTTVWQGQKNFWQFGDTAVQPVQCTVWDYIFDDIDSVNVNKCHAAPNSTTNELAFYFPSKRTMINVSANLLRFSQVFADPTVWLTRGAVPTPFAVLIKAFYVYEPQYRITGWPDDAGVSIISWWDRDLHSDITQIIYAPDGGVTSTLLMEDGTNGIHAVKQSIIKASERITYTFSVYAHDSSTRNLTLRAVAGQDYAFATFVVTSGNLIATGVSSPRFSLIEAKVIIDTLGTGRDDPTTANGWRRYVMTFTSDDSSTLELFIHNTKGTELSYQGEPPKGVLMWGAQLVLGPDPLDYQATQGILRQNETRRYVKVNVAEGMAWDSGRLSRSAWLDESVWGTPLGADTTIIPPKLGTNLVTAVFEEAIANAPMRNLIQQHEIGFDDDLEPMKGVFAETGYTELGDGTMLMLVAQVHPDMKWFGRDGGVKISIRATNYPQGVNHLYGPWSMTPDTQWFNPNVRARYAAIRYDWEPRLGYSARVGLTTFHVKPAGRLP